MTSYGCLGLRHRFAAHALVVVGGWCVLSPRPSSAQDAPAIVLVNATVVDVERGELIRNQSIVTQGGRIERVGPSARTAIPRGARRIDIGGRYVIPGLWDMHVHIAGDAPLPALSGYYGSLFLRYGITGVRDAGGDAGVLRALDSIGRVSGGMPRVVYSGDKIGPTQGQRLGIAEVRTAIAARKAAGATFIKLIPVYPLDLFTPTLAACEAVGLKCVAHLPAADSGLWLSARGRGSYEHLFNLPEHVSRVPATELFAAEQEYVAPTLVQRVLYKLRLRHRPEEPNRVRRAMRDSDKDQAFFGRLASSGTWMTPTLLLHHYLTRTIDLVPEALNPQLVLKPLTNDPRSDADRQGAIDNWNLWSGLVRGMSLAGVNMLAGTDFFPEHVPGAALLAELELLQQAGVSPLQALRMATYNPARYFGATDSSGSVRAGRVADLVVLGGNPLESVRHIADVQMVMARGRFYSRPALDSLTGVAAQAVDEMRRPSRVPGTGTR